MTDKIDVIKQALEKGERASISTKDFEYIIEQLQLAHKLIEELGKQIKEQRKHYTGQLLAMVNRYNILHNDIKFEKAEQKLKQIEKIINASENVITKYVEIETIIKGGS